MEYVYPSDANTAELTAVSRLSPSWEPWERVKQDESTELRDNQEEWAEERLGSDDMLRSRPVKDEQELTNILFHPHGWLKQEHPDWFGSITDAVQITQIYIYPVFGLGFVPTQPVVEVVKTRPVITFRGPLKPIGPELRFLAAREAFIPEKVTLVLRIEDRLAYGHYHMGDEEHARVVLRTMLANPQYYMNELGAASRPVSLGGSGVEVRVVPQSAANRVGQDAQGNPLVTFKVAENAAEIRFVCQLVAEGERSFTEPAKPPACTMFTGTMEPDPSVPDGWVVTADTFWAADWPPQPANP